MPLPTEGDHPMKLTDSQLLILSGAAKRSDGSVLPLPKSVRLNKGAATLVLKSLLKHRLVAEQAAGHEPEAWRDDGDGNRIALSITPAGLNAIGIEDLPERTLEESATKSEDARSIVGSAAATEWIQHPLPISGPIPKNAKRKLDRVHRVVRTDRIESNPLGIHSDFSHIQLGECP